MSADLRKGWTTSVSVHLLLLIVFMLVQVPSIARKADFAEVSWAEHKGDSVPLKTKEDEQKQVADVAATEHVKVSQVKKAASQPVVLPERQLADLTNESLPVPNAKKLETVEHGSVPEKSQSGLGDSKGERIAGTRTGAIEQGPPAGKTGVGSGSTRASGSGIGGDVARDVGFSIRWSSGGSRQKTSGDLPRYPEGVNVEAQIKILTVVAADGSVRMVQPAQKAHTRLENAAMKELRFWKFEPLKPDQPQIDQNCVITFLFRLK